MINRIKKSWLVALLVCLIPGVLFASDRVHHYITNNSAETIDVEIVYIFADPADSATGSDGCVESTVPPACGSSCSGTYTVGPWQTPPDLCSFLICSVALTCTLGNYQDGNYIVNGVQLSNDVEWSINDPSIGPLVLDSGSQVNDLHDSGGGEYNLTYTYSGGIPPLTVMTLPVTTFTQYSLEAQCTFNNIAVNNPAGAVSVNGAGVWISSSTCTGSMSSCAFTLEAVYPTQETVTVTDGTTNVDIEVACLPAPMSLPVDTFTDNNSDGAACVFPNVSVLSAQGPLSISGSGTSITNDTCPSGLPGCSFTLNVAYGNQGSATVTDGTTNVPIQVSCLTPTPMTVADMTVNGYAISICGVRLCNSNNLDCCACEFDIDVDNSAATATVSNISGDTNISFMSSTCFGPQQSCRISYMTGVTFSTPMNATVTDGVTTIPNVMLNSCTF